MTLLNPEKSMEVNDSEPDKKHFPRLVTLLNPAKLNGSKVRNDVQAYRKQLPIVVTLRNPDKLIDSNDEHSDKKWSSIAVIANGALRSRLRNLVRVRNLYGITVTTCACRNNCATSGSSTRASLAGVRSVSPNARRAVMAMYESFCVNTTVSPALSAVMLMSSPSSSLPKPMSKLSSANPVVAATFCRRSFAVSSTSTSTTYVLPSKPSMLSSIGALCVLCVSVVGVEWCK